MTQRTQRAAAIQAAQANNAILAFPNRKRCNSQASNQTVTSPRIRAEPWQSSPSYRGSPPPMDALMQSSMFHDDRRSMVPAPFGSGHVGETADNNMLQLYLPDSVGEHGFAPSHVTADPGSHSWSQRSSSFSYYEPSMYGHQHHRGYSDAEHESGLHVGLGGTLNLANEYRRQDALHSGDHSSVAANKSTGTSADDSYEDSTDSDLPPEKRKLSAAFRPRGKKKRNKCTPEQLRSLEAFFDKNRNPTGRIRQELSRKLRMPERSVQVWFQNRRAKVKTLVRRGDAGDTRKRSRGEDRDSDDSGGSDGLAARKENHDSAPSVKALATSALCIGTWRRVSPLICFFSRRLQSLTWYLTSESIGFKLEIPWTSIRAAYFDGPWTPSIAERAEGVRVPLGHFVIDLDRPPTFFMEVFRSTAGKGGKEGEHKTSWRQCEDFTEHRQATTNPRHILNGPYEELRDAVMALAQSNDVLEKMIEFRDQERRASGSVPIGSSSTAENFGLLGADGSSPSLVSPEMMLPPADCPAGVFENNTSLPPSNAFDATTSAAAWSMFRSPSIKVEAGWEFDSPASAATSLSESSFDSFGRYPMSYHGGGWKDNFVDESPRSGLGTSMELNGLRIDTAGISSFSPAMFGTRIDDHHRVDTWESSMSYESAPGHSTGYTLGGDNIFPSAIALDGRSSSSSNAQVYSHSTTSERESHRVPAYATSSSSGANDAGDRAGIDLMLNDGSLAPYGASQPRRATMLDEDLFHGATPTARNFSNAGRSSATSTVLQIHPELVSQQRGQYRSESDGQGRARANTYRQPDFGGSRSSVDDEGCTSSEADAAAIIHNDQNSGGQRKRLSHAASRDSTAGVSGRGDGCDLSADLHAPATARPGKSSPHSTPDVHQGVSGQ